MNIKLNKNEDGMVSIIINFSFYHKIINFLQLFIYHNQKQTIFSEEPSSKITINKIESVYNESNTNLNNRNESSNTIKGRSKRTIKKSKYDDSIISNEEFLDSFESESINEIISYGKQANQEEDIIMQGKLLYRYTLNQIELEGNWSMNNDATREKFS